MQSEFFTKLYENCTGFIEIRPIPGRRVFFKIDDFSGIAEHCKRNTHVNLFFGVATRDGQAGKKQNIVHVPTVWCDVDFKTTSKEICREKMARFPFRPSVVVCSGGGVHLYWTLREPAEKSEIGMIENVNKRIAHAMGGDPNAVDAARVLRVPGTINHKYPRLVRVHRFNPFQYILEDFIDILPEASGADNQPHVNIDFSESILRCEFLRWARDYPQDVTEPLWYAVLSNLVSVRPGGYSLCHMFSKGHPKYKPDETDRKVHQALDAAAPHTCAFIKKNGFKCPTDCKVKSPVGLIYKNLNGVPNDVPKRAGVSFG